PACFIESHQDSQIRFRRRPAESASRQVFGDLFRASGFACGRYLRLRSSLRLRAIALALRVGLALRRIADVNQGATQSGNSIRIVGSFDLKERVGVIAEGGLQAATIGEYGAAAQSAAGQI